MKAIDMTPTWVALLPALVEVAANGTSAEARKLAMGELYKLARSMDERIAAAKDLDALSMVGQDVCGDCGVGTGEHNPLCVRITGDRDEDARMDAKDMRSEQEFD